MPKITIEGQKIPDLEAKRELWKPVHTKLKSLAMSHATTGTTEGEMQHAFEKTKQEISCILPFGHPYFQWFEEGYGKRRNYIETSIGLLEGEVGEFIRADAVDGPKDDQSLLNLCRFDWGVNNFLSAVSDAIAIRKAGEIESRRTLNIPVRMSGEDEYSDSLVFDAVAREVIFGNANYGDLVGIKNPHSPPIIIPKILVPVITGRCYDYTLDLLISGKKMVFEKSDTAEKQDMGLSETTAEVLRGLQLIYLDPIGDTPMISGRMGDEEARILKIPIRDYLQEIEKHKEKEGSYWLELLAILEHEGDHVFRERILSGYPGVLLMELLAYKTQMEFVQRNMETYKLHRNLSQFLSHMRFPVDGYLSIISGHGQQMTEYLVEHTLEHMRAGYYRLSVDECQRISKAMGDNNKI